MKTKNIFANTLFLTVIFVIPGCSSFLDEENIAGQSAEEYLAEIKHYADTCTKYSHLHASVDIANRYLSVATFLVKQMKGE